MHQLKLWRFAKKAIVNISLFAIVMPPANIWICGRFMGECIPSVRLEINRISLVLDLQPHGCLENVGVSYTDADSTMRGLRENMPRRLQKGASARVRSSLSSLCQALGQVDSPLRKSLLDECNLHKKDTYTDVQILPSYSFTYR
jgi:hypothetical protein